MPGVLSSVCQRAVVRARFFKMYKHRGPKTGKDDRLGFYYQHNKRGTQRAGYVSKDGSYFVSDPLMQPQIKMPDLTNFKLRPYLSNTVKVKESSSKTVSDYIILNKNL